MAEMVRDRFLFAPNEVEIQEEIGKGAYSRVFAAVYKNSSGQMCKAAAKKIKTSSMQHREIQSMRQLDHKNIIKFYGVYIVGMNETYILMELAERKDLRCFLNRYRVEKPNPVRLPRGLVWKWVTEAASALDYLHALHQSHCDIKSLNYLVMLDYTLKLGDLGHINTKGGGTCRWMAPEVISMQLMRSPKSDVFSFGIVVWEIVTTEIPFFMIIGDFKIMRAICDGKRPEIPDDCPSELKYLMQSCWEADYNKRPTMEIIGAALQSCIAGKPVFSPAVVNLEVSDVHMTTQSPYSSREQIDGGGDTLPGVVPVEISSRGRRTLSAYNKAIKFGKNAVYRSRLMIVGQERVGKTSLMNKLLGRRFNQNEETTESIDPSSRCTIDVCHVTNWKEVPNRDPHKIYINAQADCLKEELKNLVSSEQEPEEILTTSESQQMSPSEEQTGQSLAMEQSSNDINEVAFSMSVGSIPEQVSLAIMESRSNEVNEDIELSLWDFAGQDLYYITHQVFLSKRVLFVVVFKLSEGEEAAAPRLI
ncbi:uncharacterized protein [Amphiura filiformis]|uniref:uncharacterized protein n=1 Tax=Amphiura filiformis TaxID=82378 RepID=UPI003B225AD5